MNSFDRIKSLEKSIYFNDNEISIIWYDDSRLSRQTAYINGKMFEFSEPSELYAKIDEIEKQSKVNLIHYIRKND